jgi:glycerol-3-phosphate dehydrogenase (NAD(P)+)
MNDSVATEGQDAAPLGVLGAGAWGTALAQVAALNGRRVILWAFEPEIVREINAEQTNALSALPDHKLAPQITATCDMAALARCGVILAAVPAQFSRAMLRQLAPHLPPGAIIALCAKGIEQESLALMTEVLAQEAPAARAVVLSGPGFARDVMRGLPTAVTIASADPAAASCVIAAIGAPTFRPYFSDDPIGAEIGGSVKNVIAIACGVSDGRKLGEGARAALITRGFAEMTRLGLARGGKLETMNGLSGLGDLVLTCVSPTSRNASFGMEIGAGAPVRETLAKRHSVVEGAASAPAVAALAAKCGVDMPICRAVDALLAGRVDVDQAIAALLSRPFRAEGV